MIGIQQGIANRRAVVWLGLLIPWLMAHHPGFPSPLDMVPLEEEDWVLVTTPGFVSSAQERELICKEAFGATGLLYAAVMGPTHFAVENEDGLAVTVDGCDVQYFYPLSGWIVDLASRGGERLAFVVDEVDEDRLYWSVDGGASLAGDLGIDPDLTVTAVDWIDDRQVVLSAFHEANFTDRGSGRLVVVDIVDQTTREVVLEEGLQFPYLMATDSDALVLAARVGQGIELVWGPLDDPDRHRVELEIWPLRAAIGEGGEVYVVLFEIYAEWTGLAIATDEGLSTQPRFSHRDVRCVVVDAGGLWLCSSGIAEAYELWRVDGAEEPKPFYRLAYLEGPRSDCPADSAVAQTCPQLWEQVVDEIPRRPLEIEEEPGLDEPTLPEWLEETIDGAEQIPLEEEDEDSSGRCAQVAGGPVGLWWVVVLVWGAMVVLGRARRGAGRVGRRFAC